MKIYIFDPIKKKSVFPQYLRIQISFSIMEIFELDTGRDLV